MRSIALMFVAALAMNAATLTLDSMSVFTSNNVTGINLPVSYSPPTYSPFVDWITVGQRGGTTGWYDPAIGSVTQFTGGFFVPGSVNSGGFLTYQADDTADFWLNGVLLFSSNPSANCHNPAIQPAVGCQSGEGGIIMNLAPYIHSGWNTVVADVLQTTRDPVANGIELRVEYTPTPEPASMAMLGSGMIGLFALSRRFLRR